ncbi:MAG: hypothetical protein U5R31_03940 [Acidimicrobiia bacterium]|nr:hypothetical protein [Acidimicrobiia bacterium]
MSAPLPVVAIDLVKAERLAGALEVAADELNGGLHDLYVALADAGAELGPLRAATRTTAWCRLEADACCVESWPSCGGGRWRGSRFP